jgi:AraC-like DNA-binding protein
MQHQEFEPPAALQDVIKCFWYDSREIGATTSAIEVVPDGYAEIIFHFGSGCSVSDQGQIVSLPSPFMIGLLNHPVHFYAKNRFEIIGVRCFPWTVFDLLGLPSGKDGVRMFEHPVAQLQPALQICIDSGNIDEAIVQLTEFFRNARSHIAANSLLSKAGTAMQEALGAMPVKQVAAKAHATVRTLERNFKQSSGHTVKDISALMRFEHVRNRLWTEPEVSLAGLAQELGYTDQSHLSREFKRYSGTTPAAFARSAKKGRQVISNNFVAFVQV